MARPTTRQESELSDVIDLMRRESQRVFPERQRDGHAYHSVANALDKGADALEAANAEIERWKQEAARFEGHYVATCEEAETLRAQNAVLREAVEHCLREHGGYVIRGETERKLHAALADTDEKADQIKDVLGAGRNVLACLSQHGFEPGEDPRISDLADAIRAYDGDKTDGP